MNDLLRARRRPKRGSLPDSVGDRKFGRHSVKGYRILRRIATTDLASVYLAERASNGATVVLKVLTRVPDIDEGSDLFDRFLRE